MQLHPCNGCPVAEQTKGQITSPPLHGKKKQVITQNFGVLRQTIQ